MGAFEFNQVGEFFLLTPANGSVELSRQPTFIWQLLHDTLGPVNAYYRLILSRNSGFIPADTSPHIIDTVWQTPLELSVSQSYYWKVLAVTDSGDTIFDNNNFRVFRIDAPPAIPIPIDPNNGAEAGPNSYLIWKKSVDGDFGDTVFYSLQADDQPNFGSPEILVTNLTENSNLAANRLSSNLIGFQLNSLAGFSNLRDDTTYYWRVKAIDNHGADSGWTDGTKYFDFNSTNSPPNPVDSGFSPSGGQTEIDLTPEISWSSASDPDPSDHPGTLIYNLLLDDDGEFDTSVQYQYSASNNTSYFVSDSLTDNTHWYYVVQTVDDEGATSPYSAIQDFFSNSRNEPPANFALTYPANNGKIITKAPILNWEDATDPDPSDTVSYSLTLSADSQFLFAFTQPGLTASSFSVPSGLLSRGIQYFWKVKATDTRDSAIFSNESFRFRLLYLGDLNGDGVLSPTDLVLLLNHVFLGDPVSPPEVADMNCDGNKTPADVVIGLNMVFLGQAAPCDP